MSDNSIARGGLGLRSRWADGDGATGGTWTDNMNANWDKLDAFLGPLKDKDLTAPPGSPAEGDAYIVAASPTGAWAGHAKDIAVYRDAAWRFYTPKEGVLFWVNDENLVYAFDGANWVTYAPGATLPGSVATVGLDARRWSGTLVVQAGGKYPGISLAGSSDTSIFILYTFPASFNAVTGWDLLFTSTGDFGAGVDWRLGAYKFVNAHDLSTETFTDGATTTIVAPTAADVLKIATLNAPAISPVAGEQWMLRCTRLGSGDANNFAAIFVGLNLRHT